MSLSREQRHDFIKNMVKLSIPLTIQSIFFSSKSLTDVLMLGHLSDEAVAAVGVVARVFMIASFVIFATANAGGTLIAQYFGAKQKLQMQQAFQSTMWLALFFATPVFLVFITVPHWVIGLASNDPQVIAYGATYLQIVATQLIASSYLSTYSAALRSTHHANVATIYSVVGICVNLGLNYVLIFGKFGAPELGVTGAALATLIAVTTEVILLTLHVKLAGLALPLFGPGWYRLPMLKPVFKLAWPIAINMIAYAGGLFAYVVIFGNISTEALAALSLLTPIESIAISMLLAMASAIAVLIGNAIGGGQSDETVYELSKLATWLGTASAIGVALLMLAIEPFALGWLSGFSDSAEATAAMAYKIVAAGVVVRALPIIIIIGILRAGGDNRFCLYQDVIAQWGIGIPVVALLGLVLGAPLAWVFAAIFLEEAVKAVGSLWRLHSRRWINNLVGAPA